MHPQTPILIGAAQTSEFPNRDPYLARSPASLAADAVQAAIQDCQASRNITTSIDTVAAIRQFENSTPFAVAPFGRSDNLPRSVAARIGAMPARAILSVTGGQANQALVGELAADIAAGRSDLAVLFGAEAISTVLHLQARGETRDWSESVSGNLEDRGYGIDDLFDMAMVKHGVAAPIPCYALLENARRARLGLSADAYRQEIGALFAPFTQVAARNPHAAAPVVRSAGELATITERNRVVAEPYPRMTVARDQVNQAACLILCSADRARMLGVPEERWVHIHASVEAGEPSPLQRPDLSRSPASVAAVRQALDLSGRGVDAMDAIDLYSCFAIAVFNITEALGLPVDGTRGLTLTGGLPFFGGAGNNYSMHAIVEAVHRLRTGAARSALIAANGGFMSKSAVGIYAMEPADWREPKARRQIVPAAVARVPVMDDATGAACLETFTIVPGRNGDLGAVIARHAESGARLVAVAAADDVGTMDTLRHGAPFGRRIAVRGGPGGRSVFSFAE